MSRAASRPNRHFPAASALVDSSPAGRLNSPSTTEECAAALHSPDNPATFFYCGYHSSVDFSDIGHVLYSVEPYQNVPGCSVYPGTPNGMLVDSTDNVLNHETFETITDPDGTAWINTTAIVLYGDEVGDECEYVTFVGQNAYFNPPIFKIGEHPYAVQSIYTNDVHGCGAVGVRAPRAKGGGSFPPLFYFGSRVPGYALSAL